MLLKCQSLLEFALGNCYAIQGKYDEALKNYSTHSNSAAFNLDHIFGLELAETLFVGPRFVDTFPKKYELSKVEMYFLAFVNEQAKQLRNELKISLLSTFLEESFSLVVKLSKAHAAKLPEEFYAPFLRSLHEKSDGISQRVFPMIMGELVGQGYYKMGAQFASVWKKNDSTAYDLFLEATLTLDQGVKLERMRCARLSEILSPNIVQFAVPPKRFDLHAGKADLELYEAYPSAVFKKYSPLLKTDVLGLLLNTAIVLCRYELAARVLHDIPVNKANLTVLTQVDSSGWSPIAYCLESGNDDMLDTIQDFILKFKTLNPVKTRYVADLGHILAQLEVPRCKNSSPIDYYEIFLRPLYWNLAPVIDFLRLLDKVV